MTDVTSRAVDDAGQAPLVRAFSSRIAAKAGVHGAAVARAAAAALAATLDGHVCVDLARVHATEEGPPGGTLEDFRSALLASGLVGRPGERRPLVLDHADRLYLLRYWQYEADVAAAWRARNADMCAGQVDADRFARVIEALCGPETGLPASPEQRAAVAIAVLGRMVVISGGPGTGKTTTAARVLAAIAAMTDGPAPRFALAAPTGKAAARLGEAMTATLAGLHLPESARAALPTEASTVHRLLGVRPGTATFRHHRDAPLPVDCLLVDEASMIDIGLMARLLDALRPEARLVLLGDPDQLEAVEAGAVLGSLVAGNAGFPGSIAQLVARVTGVVLPADASARPGAGARAKLTVSRRFDAGSGIGRLATGIRDRDVAGVTALLADAPDDVRHLPGADALRERLIEGFTSYAHTVMNGGTPAEVLAALGRVRVLAAHRHGRHGASGLNEWIRQLLAGPLGMPMGRGDWYSGRAVMIERNDYRLELFNGDIGVALPDPTGRLRVWFDRGGGKCVAFAPARLPEHASAFAMTVHKSQGSEFDEVVLVLPTQASPVVTRELLYTAVTRARRSVAIAGPLAVVRAGIESPQWREGGLADRLWGDGAE